ncbi:MAG: hypothetical protein H6621_01195 [Halobacteriovoraceae bacterium]|nr:hypothetical protein [Halobacteriovoraceae bacterium]MCB9093658.1 hypothetical protein [Halobacteriovoraceae bacterium]
MHKKIKIGLLLDSLTVPAWQYAMLEKIHHSQSATIQLLIVNQSKSEKVSAFKKLCSRFERLIYFLHYRLDRAIFKPRPDAFTPKNLEKLLSQASQVSVSPRQTSYSDYIEGENLKKIKDADLDILIRLGFRILRGEILGASRLGIWSYHHGDNQVNRGGPPGYWETMKGRSESGVVLQVLSEKLDNGKVIDRTWSSTNLYSVSRNVNNFYWKATNLLPRALERLHTVGEKQFFEERSRFTPEIASYSHPLYKTPTNFECAVHTCKQIRKILMRALFRLTHRYQWALLYQLQDDLNLEPRKFKKLTPPRDRFWADPHVVTHNNKFYIFFEDLPFKTNKGYISVIEMDKDGKHSEAQKVLEKDHHLSYPFVFKHQKKFYMIPETSQNKTIELYEATDFPFKWQFKMNLMENINTADTTLFFHNNKWWMFTAPLEYAGANRNDELFVYYSDKLESSNWVSYPLNPLLSDVKNARPAGAVFSHNGKLYLPLQDNSKTYGYACNINRIVELSEEKIVLEPVTKLEPLWDKNAEATHSLAHVPGLTVIDVCFTVPLRCQALFVKPLR